MRTRSHLPNDEDTGGFEFEGLSLSKRARFFAFDLIFRLAGSTKARHWGDARFGSDPLPRGRTDGRKAGRSDGRPSSIIMNFAYSRSFPSPPSPLRRSTGSCRSRRRLLYYINRPTTKRLFNRRLLYSTAPTADSPDSRGNSVSLSPPTNSCRWKRRYRG